MNQPSPQPEPRIGTGSIDLCRAVLFDFDGTLADTAPDLVAAANKMRTDRGLDMLPYEQLRPLASAGARGLIGGAFGVGPDHRDYASMRDEFLANYEADICVETTLFSGIGELLDGLDERGIRWGIVTNKIGRLTMPLVEQLGLAERARCVVSGDTTPHAKPHPAPLLHAANELALQPEVIAYIGDDLRDVQAGFAAGMVTVAAAYGYCGLDLPPTMWHAQHVVDSPGQLQRLLSQLNG
jgi:2-phosphoglycolate phosphatase